MPQNVFRVTGSFRAKHHDQPFSREVVSKDEAAARERMLSLIGSKHGAPRRLIVISKVEKIPFEKVEDPVVRHAAELKA